MQWQWRTSRTRGGGGHQIAHFDADDHTAAQVLRQSPESARHWPRSGRWPWRVYDPCLPSGASYGSTCLRHSSTDDSSNSYRRIRTPGRSGQMPCPCLGTTGGTFLYAFLSFKMVPQVLQKIAQSPGVEVILIAQLNRQHHGSQSWWTYPKKIRFHCSSKVKTYWHKTFGRETGWPRTSLPTVWKLSRPSWEQRVFPGKLPTWCQGAVGNLHNKCMNPIGQDSWRSVGWKVFRVRSHHFSTYMMHLFRDRLLPSTLISHRTWLLCNVIGCTIQQPTRTSSYWSGLSGWNVRCNAESCLSGTFIWFYYYCDRRLYLKLRYMGNPRMTSFP